MKRNMNFSGSATSTESWDDLGGTTASGKTWTGLSIRSLSEVAENWLMAQISSNSIADDSISSGNSSSSQAHKPTVLRPAKKPEPTAPWNTCTWSAFTTTIAVARSQ